MKQDTNLYIIFLYKQYCQNIQVFQDYDNFWRNIYKNWILKWIVETSIKSYIEMVENKMWQNSVEMNEISNDKYWSI